MMPRILPLLFALTIPLFLQAQDLDSAWRAYMSTQSEIEDLANKKAAYQQEQIRIKKELDALQRGSAWYNAWLNKYLQTTYTERQLVIRDSLQFLDESLNGLQPRQLEEINALKQAYDKVLTDYASGMLPSDENLQNMGMGQFRSLISEQSIPFPDYTSLLSIDWESQEHRRLLLDDVRRLLQAKLSELDSIRQVRINEEELATRLADFHADMGLQMEADKDAQRRDAYGNTEKSLGWSLMDAAAPSEMEAYVGDGGSDEMLDMSREATSLSNVSMSHKEIDPLTQASEDSRDVSVLNAKILEYQTLLRTVEMELEEGP